MKSGIQQLNLTFSTFFFFFAVCLNIFVFSPAVYAQKNLALGKRAYQSSTKFGAEASRAVDGKTNGLWHNNSTTCTEQEAGAWWEVDLGAVYNINKVVVYNRTDAGSERLASMQVFFKEEKNARGELLYSMSGNPGIKMEIEHSTCFEARYIRIQLSKAEHLSLAEVQVFGTGCGQEIAKSKSKKSNNQLAYQKVQLYTSSLY